MATDQYTEAALASRREASRKFREKNPTYYADRMRESKAKDPVGFALRVRRNALKFSYGITTEDYERMLKSQKGKCAICKSTDKGQTGKGFFCVDHDHKTGKIRGLLCHRCNRGLGLLSDSLKNVERAVKYLKGELSWSPNKLKL
jgi:hypothetical protein